MKFRKETDSMGTINVDDNKYWGASTERSKKYFDIGKILVSKSLINAIAMIKLCAAQVHKKDKHTRRGLVQLVSQRKKLLKYLRKTNSESYISLIKELSIRG